VSGSSVARSHDLHLVHYWNILVRRRWAVLVFALLVVTATLIASMLATRFYASSAIIQIDTKAPVVYNAGRVGQEAPAHAWGPALKAYYSTQYQLMKSRPVLTAALERLREDADLPITDFDGDEDPTKSLAAIIDIVPDPETQLVRVVAEYPDPAKSALMANAVAWAYLEAKTARAHEESGRALKWLGEQLAEYRERKVDSEEAVHRYRFENSLVGGDGTSHVSIVTLGRLQEAWGNVHAQRIQEQAAYDALSKLSGAHALMATATHLAKSDPVMQGMLVEYQDLQQKYDRLLTRYTEKHPDVIRTKDERRGLRDQIGRQVEVVVAAHQARLELLASREESLGETISESEKAIQDLGEQLINLELLKAEAERNELFYRNLDTRLSEVALGKVMHTSNVHMVEEAIPSNKPVRPNVLANLLAAITLGLIGGATLVLVFDYFDFNVKGREDIEGELGIPFVGLVPVISSAQISELSHPLDRTIFVTALPNSIATEGLRTVRTHVLFNLPKRETRRLLITSTSPKEGKTFVAANLAATFAMSRMRVLLIDGDTRRPSVHRLYRIRNEEGVVDVLAGKKKLREVIKKTTVPGVDLVPAGVPPEHPGELFSHERLTELFDSIEGYDMIVVDSPPASIVSDAAMFASLVDGFLYVVESRSTRRAAAKHAIARLREVNSGFVGAVVNKVDTHQSGYQYDYSYDVYTSYYSTNAEGRKVKKSG